MGIDARPPVAAGVNGAVPGNHLATDTASPVRPDVPVVHTPPRNLQTNSSFVNAVGRTVGDGIGYSEPPMPMQPWDTKVGYYLGAS